MKQTGRLRRAAVGALLSCVSIMLLTGCAHHRANSGACRRPEFSGAAQDLPPLRSPPGLNTPNTTGGVHIPTLNQPPPARARNAPCLDWPPTYVSEPPVPPTRRTPPPPGPAPGTGANASPGANAGASPAAGPGAGPGPNAGPNPSP